jgi:hypothetical protein
LKRGFRAALLQEQGLSLLSNNFEMELNGFWWLLNWILWSLQSVSHKTVFWRMEYLQKASCRFDESSNMKLWTQRIRVSMWWDVICHLMLVLSLLDQCTQRNLGLQRELSKATSKHSTRYTSIPYIFLSHLFRQSHTHFTQYLCCLCSFIFQLKMVPLLLLDPFGATSCSWNFVTSVDLRGACIRGCFVPENCMCIRGIFCDWKLLQHPGLWYHCLPDCFCFLLVNVEHYQNLTDNKR